MMRTNESREAEIRKLSQVLVDSGVSESDSMNMINQLRSKMDAEEPPKIAIIGQTGVGKTSTINALFNAGKPISHVAPCTQVPEEVRGIATYNTGTKGDVILYDMPGLGESIEADKRHIETYKQVLPNVDVAMWIITAGDRQLTLMQQAIKTIVVSLKDKSLERVMFAINKADIMHPNDWNDLTNTPSKEQVENLKGFAQTVESRICEVVKNFRGQMKIYSAIKRYRLPELLVAMMETVPAKRRWIYDKYADVADYLEMVDPRILETLKAMRGYPVHAEK